MKRKEMKQNETKQNKRKKIKKKKQNKERIVIPSTHCGDLWMPQAKYKT